jgi:hypothetical protein
MARKREPKKHRSCGPGGHSPLLRLPPRRAGRFTTASVSAIPKSTAVRAIEAGMALLPGGEAVDRTELSCWSQVARLAVTISSSSMATPWPLSGDCRFYSCRAYQSFVTVKSHLKVLQVYCKFVPTRMQGERFQWTPTFNDPTHQAPVYLAGRF